MVRRGSLTPDVDERVSVFGSFTVAIVVPTAAAAAATGILCEPSKMNFPSDLIPSCN